MTRSQPVGSGCFDIIGSLPLELLVQVVEYLDPADIVRSQRVSKRWRTIFSGERVIKSALHRTLGFLSLDGKDVAVDDAMIFFQWQHGLQCGRPPKKSFFPWPDSVRSRGAIYHLRRLCYRIWETNEVEMLDLETGKKSKWTDKEAVSDLRTFRLSDRYLVLVWLEGLLTAWDIHTLQKRTIKIGFFPGVIRLEKDKVVLFSTDFDPPPPIYIWDLTADQVHAIGSFREGNVWLWHIDPDDNVLVTFEIDWDKHPPEVQQTKWTLTGQLLNRKFFHLSLPVEIPFRPTEDPSHHTFGKKTVTRLFSRTDGGIAMIDLIYNHAFEKLNLRWIDHILPLKRGYFINECEHLTPYLAYQYNNVLKGLDICNTTNGTRIILPYQLDIREVTTLELLHESECQPKIDRDDDDDDDELEDLELEDEEPHALLFGDQEVLCLANYDGVQLWFFNPDFIPDLPELERFLPME